MLARPQRGPSPHQTLPSSRHSPPRVPTGHRIPAQSNALGPPPPHPRVLKERHIPARPRRGLSKCHHPAPQEPVYLQGICFSRVGFIGGTGRECVCCPLFGLRAAEEKETTIRSSRTQKKRRPWVDRLFLETMILSDRLRFAVPVAAGQETTGTQRE
jgi:hypothetical protein